MTTPESRTCTKCGETKPLFEFSLRASRCKRCRADYMKVAYADDPEKFKARVKGFRDANPDKHLASSLAWASANPDKVRAYKRKFDQANPALRRAITRRRRARRAGNGAEPYSELAIYERDGGRCKHCGVNLPLEPRSGWHIDHIVPISLGGPDTEANVQLSCPACNQEKGARLEGQIHFAV